MSSHDGTNPAVLETESNVTTVKNKLAVLFLQEVQTDLTPLASGVVGRPPEQEKAR